VRKHRSLSKEGRSDEMQDRAFQGPLPPCPTIQIQETVILPMPNVSWNNAKSECQHFGDVERCLEGTWVIDEVRLAVDKGYKILKIWKFMNTKSRVTIPKRVKADYS